ncbi:MAG TPA: DUF2231 domain-containing protein [Usitatibacter sp.]|nr:DUF2231 domain-containing protein [Usitatibacter sp.]
MRTPASIAGHPIHPMLVPIAIGGFILSFIFDIVCIATGSTDPWATVAFYTMIGGIVGALAAAIFGFVDLVSLPEGRARHVGYAHMGLNLTIVALFLWSAWLRHEEVSGNLPFALSLIGILLLTVSGWLGGKLVYEMGVGVSGEEVARGTTRPTRRHLEA